MSPSWNGLLPQQQNAEKWDDEGKTHTTRA